MARQRWIYAAAFVSCLVGDLSPAAAETRVLARPFPTETRLVRDGQADVLIVHGDAHRTLARRLRVQLRELCGVELPLMLDTEATGGRRWTLRGDVQRRNLIVLGDINTNRGVLALYAKFLAAATGRFPRPGRYVLRHLAEPFTPGHTALVIGASGLPGLECGIARFLDLLRAEGAPPGTGTAPGRAECRLGFPLVEFGDADGPVHIPEAGNTFRDYRDAAYVFYSGGRATARYAWFGPRSPRAAIRTARELVLKEAKKDAPYLPVGGHYTFIPNYQALRIIIAHGLLSADELRMVEEKLLDNALVNKDAYVTYFRSRRARLMAGATGNPSRHSSSAIVGQYLLLDYLTNFARLTDSTREPVQADYALFSKLIRDWATNRIFRARVGDLESLDCTAFFIYGFMHMGLEDFVSNRVLENMASFYLNNVNNLWCDAGASHYIGAYRGCHIRSPDGGLAVRALAFFTGDRGLEFLDTQRFEQAGTYQRGFCDKARMCLGQPEPFALPSADGHTAVLPCPVLRKTPLDPFMWRSAAGGAQEEGAPPSLTYDQAYDTIGFRDGWSSDDAFLAIKGLQRGRVWQINSIVGHTELGARFLFGGSQTHENWYRNSVTVDTAELLAQDPFARLDAYVSAGDVALISSTCARFNGTRWQRTILRRRQAYFAVLDDLTALRDDDFRVTVTWRVLPPGRIDDDGVFQAVGQNGAKFAIVPGGQYASSVTQPAVDGVSRPTFCRQQQDVQLKAREAVSFHNVIAASRGGHAAAVKAQSLGDGRMLWVRAGNGGRGEALIGTRELPDRPGLPGGQCAAFYLTEDLWLVGGVRGLHRDAEELLRCSQPVDLVVDWAEVKTVVHVHGGEPVRVSLASALGGAGANEMLAPGTHTFKLRDLGKVDLRAAVEALPSSPARAPRKPAAADTATAGFVELWRRPVQAQPATVLRPIRVQATKPPETMAVHNVHDGVLWSSSIPAPVWRIPELVLTLDPPANTSCVTGLRLIGNVGRIEVEEQDALGVGYRSLTAEETSDTLFAGYSDHRVGGRVYRGRRLSITGTGRRLRLRLSAADANAPSLHVGEIQLLGQAQTDGAWGRLRVDRLAPRAAPVLLCRTGTYVDTLEQGGSLQAFSTDGRQLWQHADAAPAQYREKYWRTGDLDGDGVKELVTYADDMVLRVYKSDGRLLSTVDLHAWEEQRRKTSSGHLYYGGKSIALWPVRSGGRPDLFVFGHVHHHQIRMGAEPEITRRDRVPTIDCAPAASVDVTGWSGAGRQNLVGVAPYQCGVVLWEDGGPGNPPKLVAQKPFTQPLVQPSANNQQPVFVECRRVRRPEGIIAATPRGVQFFARPDLKPGWVFAGMCPTSAIAVAPQRGDELDLVLLGRENGRVLLLDADTGRLRAQTLLEGTVCRIAITASENIVVGTTVGLFALDSALRLTGRHDFAVEDLAVCRTAQGTCVFALSPTGQLTAFWCAARPR